jgi:GNAT superfamily N-acetyltransferase
LGATSNSYEELGDGKPAAAPSRGIEIKELTAADHDAIYAIAVACWSDMATPEPMPAPPYDDWAYEELAGPSSSEPSTASAGRLRGAGRRPARPDVLEHGFTAVVRSHRGRGIATALKRTQLAWAAEHGYRELVTYTQEGNKRMRSINEKLGYRERPAWILVRRGV